MYGDIQQNQLGAQNMHKNKLHLIKEPCGVFTPALESGYICAPCTRYVRLRSDLDRVHHVLNVVDVALCSLKVS